MIDRPLYVDKITAYAIDTPFENPYRSAPLRKIYHNENDYGKAENGTEAFQKIALYCLILMEYEDDRRDPLS